MNWGAIGQFLLAYIEKNPQLVENLLTQLIGALVNNPTQMQNLLGAILAHYAPKQS